MGGTRIEIPHEHLQVHLSHWIYHLRMAEALLEPNTVLLSDREREYLRALIIDLLEAATDAKAWITNGTAALQSPEA